MAEQLPGGPVLLEPFPLKINIILVRTPHHKIFQVPLCRTQWLSRKSARPKYC